MKANISDSVLELVQGDITLQEVDAIVNAANGSLLGGGGVDGAIHRAAGPGLLAECKKLGGCQTGEAKITGGYNLKARYVIHGVGPVYHDGKKGEPDLLAGVYRKALELASEHKCRSVAFPAISTGVYGYPMAEAARIALSTIFHYLISHREVKLVRMVLFDPVALAIHGRVLHELTDP
jgi:O-acetyl-ADP-ribose deacetylase (regulator of RNase III)